MAPDEFKNSLTLAVEMARRGLRSDVEALITALAEGELLIPLRKNIENAPLGERLSLNQEFSLVPHLLPDGEGCFVAALFSESELMEPVAEHLGWDTDGGELRFCAMPARVALDLVLDIVDDTEVHGVAINAGTPSELFLRREELASIVQGQALPLVGYVKQIPALADQQTLVADVASAAPPELVTALTRCLATLPEITDYRLARTYNRERDLEPHLSLTLTTGAAESELGRLGEQVIAAIGPHVPPPGYLDILWQAPET